jgi:hypothetical protein
LSDKKFTLRDKEMNPSTQRPDILDLYKNAAWVLGQVELLQGHRKWLSEHPDRKLFFALDTNVIVSFTNPHRSWARGLIFFDAAYDSKFDSEASAGTFGDEKSSEMLLLVLMEYLFGSIVDDPNGDLVSNNEHSAKGMPFVVTPAIEGELGTIIHALLKNLSGGANRRTSAAMNAILNAAESGETEAERAKSAIEALAKNVEVLFDGYTSAAGALARLQVALRMNQLLGKAKQPSLVPDFHAAIDTALRTSDHATVEGEWLDWLNSIGENRANKKNKTDATNIAALICANRANPDLVRIAYLTFDPRFTRVVWSIRKTLDEDLHCLHPHAFLADQKFLHLFAKKLGPKDATLENLLKPFVHSLPDQKNEPEKVRASLNRFLEIDRLSAGKKEAITGMVKLILARPAKLVGDWIDWCRAGAATYIVRELYADSPLSPREKEGGEKRSIAEMFESMLMYEGADIAGASLPLEINSWANAKGAEKYTARRAPALRLSSQPESQREILRASIEYQSGFQEDQSEAFKAIREKLRTEYENDYSYLLMLGVVYAGRGRWHDCLILACFAYHRAQNAEDGWRLKKQQSGREAAYLAAFARRMSATTKSDLKHAKEWLVRARDCLAIENKWESAQRNTTNHESDRNEPASTETETHTFRFDSEELAQKLCELCFSKYSDETVESNVDQFDISLDEFSSLHSKGLSLIDDASDNMDTPEGDFRRWVIYSTLLQISANWALLAFLHGDAPSFPSNRNFIEEDNEQVQRSETALIGGEHEVTASFQTQFLLTAVSHSQNNEDAAVRQQLEQLEQLINSNLTMPYDENKFRSILATVRKLN